MWQRTTIASLLFALAAHAAFGFACITASGGECIHWVPPVATVTSFLGAPPSPLANGTATWDQNVMLAATDWNNTGTDFQLNVAVGGQFTNPCGACIPGYNPVFFSQTNCGGAGFGDILELVNACWDNGNNGAIINTPVFVNSTVPWNAYDGPLQSSNGQYVYDIRRVLLHELGHVHGLAHPDDNGQNVVAIMNSHVSDLDRLQPDDISGVMSIYGGGSPAPSSGCQIDTRPASPTAWLLLLPLCLAVLWLGRRGCKRISADSKTVRPE